LNNGTERLQSEQPWRALYVAVLFELDSDLLPQRIVDAQKAIGERVLALAGAGDDTKSEEKSLANAHAVLDELKRIYQAERRVA
jgi:hypothetical protein